MADRLLQPVPQPAVQVTEAGFGDQFVGYAPVNPVELQAAPPAAFVQTPATIVPAQQQMARVQEPPAAPEETPPPVEAPQPPPLPQPAPARGEVRGPFLDRVGRFRDWLHRHFAATGIFLLDREGAVIFDESGHGKLHFLARSLAVASRRPGGAAENVHVKVGAAATLEVIPVDTPYGCLVLGAVVPSPLEPGAVAAVMEALKSVASPQG
ncbi:hypothetical protein KBB96_00030 [Luteolibacter ambystomatis]|uniref:Roadblock/LC7 domain-containing protein n=1 Tax=Luteolibacter ambystomatis TaxID=2824561 RepID=A0A975G976_9BACT|nr:hypothetical protein [Luteolibacter ambystomatis]QUE51303.1 hypothetical protein KBB96_00030 [Luteolibacter ambystomatis]